MEGGERGNCRSLGEHQWREEEVRGASMEVRGTSMEGRGGEGDINGGRRRGGEHQWREEVRGASMEGGG